jgi:hypothetical protein
MQVSFDIPPRLAGKTAKDCEDFWVKSDRLGVGTLACLWWDKEQRQGQGGAAATEPQVVVGVITDRDIKKLVPHRGRPAIGIRYACPAAQYAVKADGVGTTAHTATALSSCVASQLSAGVLSAGVLSTANTDQGHAKLQTVPLHYCAGFADPSVQHAQRSLNVLCFRGRGKSKAPERHVNLLRSLCLLCRRVLEVSEHQLLISQLTCMARSNVPDGALWNPHEMVLVQEHNR